MGSEGLQGWSRRKERGQRSQAALSPPGIQNRLNRDLSALESETKWVTDITEMPTGEDKPCLHRD